MTAMSSGCPYYSAESLWPPLKKPKTKEICDDCKFRYKECVPYCRKQKKKTITEGADVIIVECNGFDKEEPINEENKGETI